MSGSRFLRCANGTNAEGNSKIRYLILIFSLFSDIVTSIERFNPEEKITREIEGGAEHRAEKAPIFNIEKYISDKSSVLVKKGELTEELAKIADPKKGILGYYDKENVNFSVEGYDFVYFNQGGDLCQVKIVPEDISDLETTGKLRESEELEEKIKRAGFQLDQSERFRSAIWRQLNT